MFFIAFLKVLIEIDRNRSDIDAPQEHSPLFFLSKPKFLCMVLPKTGQPSCIFELYTQLTSLFITRLFTGNVVELLVPFIKRKIAERSESAAAAESGKELSPAERQFTLKDYETKGLQVR
jgi:hypothetical protein